MKDFFWLLIFILISVFLKLCALGRSFNDKIVLTSTLDFSWQTDIIERFLHGFIAGRDFTFTYGPLYQLLASIPALVFKMPSYISIAYAQIIFIIIACALVFFIVKLITTNRVEIIILSGSLLFFIDLNSYLYTSDLIRILFPLFYALLYTKYASIKCHFSLKMIAILLLPTVFGLYTFDLFVIGILITGVFILYEIIMVGKVFKYIFTKRVKKYWLNGIAQLLIILTFEVIISLLLSKNFNYILYSSDTVRNYQFIMNIPWSFNRSSILFIFPIALVIIYFYSKKSDKRQLVLIITALLELKSAFIRADEGHVIQGIYPSIMVLSIMVYFIIQRHLSGKAFIALFSLLVLLYILIPYRSGYYSDISVKNLKTALTFIHQDKSFFDIYKLQDTSKLKISDFHYFESIISKYAGRVMVYPYDNYILNISGTTFNTLPLQFYQYSNSLVEKKSLENLRKSPPEFIILGVEGKTVVSLDNTPNFSRNPLIAKWMFGNYTVYKNMKNYLILKYDPKRKSEFYRTSYICDMDTSSIMKTEIFETLFKPSFYYLNNTHYRLPYNSNTKEIFIINKYNDADELEKLFERKINFDKYTLSKNSKYTIIKKYPIPKIKREIRGTFWLKCY